jgi:hypothetical protein
MKFREFQTDYQKDVARRQQIAEELDSGWVAPVVRLLSSPLVLALVMLAAVGYGVVQIVVHTVPDDILRFLLSQAVKQSVQNCLSLLS